MAKVKLNKYHNGIEAGQPIEATDEQKHYFESVGLLAKEEKQAVKTKEEKLVSKTK